MSTTAQHDSASISAAMSRAKPHMIRRDGRWIETPGNALELSEPGLELMRRVRGGFILQDTTLGEWCDANGISKSNARHALIGSWNGPKGKALRTKIVKAAAIFAKAAA